MRSTLLPSVAVIGGGIIVSVAAFLFAGANVENEAQLKFEKQAGDAQHAIEARISSYTDIIHALRALLTSSDHVSRRQFHNFVEQLELGRRFPGFVNLNYAEQVTDAERATFVKRVREDRSLTPEGYPDFDITPPGQRPYYHVLTYLEPMKGNEVSHGRDILMQPGRKATFEHALNQLNQSGELLSSGRPVLIDGPKRFWAMAMRLPVYRPGMPIGTVDERRAALMGTLGAGFRVSEMMQNVLDRQALATLRFRIFEAGPIQGYTAPEKPVAEKRLLLFDSAGAPDADPRDAVERVDEGSQLFTVLQLPLAGRMWEIQYIAPRDAMVSSGDRALPWLVLVGGILMSILLYGMAHSLASSRTRAIALARDITKDLRYSEASLAEAQHMAHLGSWTLDIESRSMSWSDETFRILDAAPHAASPSLELFTERIHPEDRALLHAALHQAGSNHEEVEYRLMTGNGHIRWVHVLIRSAPEREGVLQGTIMDITERRGAEEELRSYAEQLRSVSRRLLEVQETERRLLAGELHDRVGQSLTALGLNLSIIDRLLSAAAAPALRARLADSSSLVEQTMDSMRNVMGELRPQGLDDYGVVAPLRALAAAFSQRTGIRVEFEGSGPAARVGSSVSLAMFRIAQEALNNIAKHSKATVVQISFAGNDDRAILSISDNGVGFDAAHRKRRGWGLAIMQERAEAVGARFRLDSNEGGGTRITVDYAIPSTADAAQAETHAD